MVIVIVLSLIAAYFLYKDAHVYVLTTSGDLTWLQAYTGLTSPWIRVVEYLGGLLIVPLSIFIFALLANLNTERKNI
jgi:hypothetical protein